VYAHRRGFHLDGARKSEPAGGVLLHELRMVRPM